MSDVKGFGIWHQGPNTAFVCLTFLLSYLRLSSIHKLWHALSDKPSPKCQLQMATSFLLHMLLKKLRLKSQKSWKGGNWGREVGVTIAKTSRKIHGNLVHLICMSLNLSTGIWESLCKGKKKQARATKIYWELKIQLGNIQHWESITDLVLLLSITSLGKDTSTDVRLLEICYSLPYVHSTRWFFPSAPSQDGISEGKPDLTWAREQLITLRAEQVESTGIQPRAEHQLQHVMGS